MFSNEIPQFGSQPPEYANRISAYAVVFNDQGQILALKVGKTIHLPGGGIDSGEDPQVAVVRESQEEAGCEISSLEYLGKANQFFAKTEYGPLNKVGTFYTAKLVSFDPSKGVEATHVPHWFAPEEFIAGPSGEFQKWAVKKAME